MEASDRIELENNHGEFDSIQWVKSDKESKGALLLEFRTDTECRLEPFGRDEFNALKEVAGTDSFESVLSPIANENNSEINPKDESGFRENVDVNKMIECSMFYTVTANENKRGRPIKPFDTGGDQISGCWGTGMLGAFRVIDKRNSEKTKNKKGYYNGHQIPQLTLNPSI